MSDATEAEVEAVARALARLDPGEDWPTNFALGGGLTGALDDEYRSAMRDQAREAIAALDAVRGTTQLAAKVEALRQAAEVVVLDAGDEATGPEPDPNLAELAHCVAVLAGEPGRSEAEIKAEALLEAADAIAELADFYDEDNLPAFDSDVEVREYRAATRMAHRVYRDTAPMWLRARAARVVADGAKS